MKVLVLFFIGVAISISYWSFEKAIRDRSVLELADFRDNVYRYESSDDIFRGKVEFFNGSSRSLEIVALSSTCGCAVVKSSSSDVESGLNLFEFSITSKEGKVTNASILLRLRDPVHHREVTRRTTVVVSRGLPEEFTLRSKSVLAVSQDRGPPLARLLVSGLEKELQTISVDEEWELFSYTDLDSYRSMEATGDSPVMRQLDFRFKGDILSSRTFAQLRALPDIVLRLGEESPYHVPVKHVPLGASTVSNGLEGISLSFGVLKRNETSSREFVVPLNVQGFERTSENGAISYKGMKGPESELMTVEFSVGDLLGWVEEEFTVSGAAGSAPISVSVTGLIVP